MTCFAGRILVAAPQLQDPNFARTVLLMLAHSEEGAHGLVLNRPTQLTVGDIADQVFEEPVEWEKPLQIGGPVPGPLVIIHGQEELADAEILPGIFRTSEAERVQELIRSRAEPSVIIANYAGWGPGQLEAEMLEDVWIALPASLESIFDGDVQTLWERIIRRHHTGGLADLLGIRNFPEVPDLN